MTIPAADVRTPIVAVAIAVPLAVISTAICVRTPIVAVVAVPLALISISTAICTPLNSAVDASNAPGC